MIPICAGIISYNPDILRLMSNINSILSQVEKVYIIDNGSKNLDEIKLLCGNEKKINLICNEDNYGIAKALNQACLLAERDGFDWILTLDQDTVSPIGMVQKLVEYVEDERLGIICPAVYYEGLNKSTVSEELTTYVYACMTSGSLTRIKAWRDVGGFNESYFIDFVDNEFCMKLKINGYGILRVNACQIKHCLGETGRRKILGVYEVTFSYHTPFRFYYMIRNNRFFISEYRDNLPLLKEMCKLWYIIISGIFNSNQRYVMFKCAVKGYLDAKKKKMGKASLKL